MKIGIKTMEDGIMKKSLCIAAALSVLAACSREVDFEVPAGDMTLVARTETPADTRTVVEGGTHVYWEPGDEIAVFSGSKSGIFTTDLTAPAATAAFYGTLGDDAWTEGEDLWAVYPYAADAYFGDGTLATTLPSNQVARAGSFGQGTNLALAHSTTADLQFYNVFGGIRFSLAEEGITEVVLEGFYGDQLAGKVAIGLRDGFPAIQYVAEGETSITLTPPEGSTFAKDTWYFIVALPGTLRYGFRMTFIKGDKTGYRTFDKAVTLKRGIFGTITHADEGVIYASDEVISFKDPLVKAICVERWDTNGDGELSEKEAAAVTNLKGAFSDNKEITSFDEFVFFTGVTKMDDGNSFGNCSSLVSITLPEGITRFGVWTFGRCYALKELTLPAGVVDVGITTFYECTSLEKLVCLPTVPPQCGQSFLTRSKDGWIVVPKESVEAYKAADGWKEYAHRIVSADEIESPAISFKDPAVKAICVEQWDKDGDGELSEREAACVSSLGRAFLDNREITSFDELAYFTGLTAVDDWAFYNCAALKSVVLPESVTSIGACAFYFSTSLGRLTCLAPNPPACGENFLTFTKDGWIVVPEGSVDRYKAADGWKDYPNRFVTAAELDSPAISFKDPAVKAVCLERWDRDSDGELSEREAASVTAIPAWVFTNNTDIVSFDELAYFSGLKALDDYAFSGCSSLKSITLPEGLVSLGKHALAYCPALASVVCLSTVPPAFGENVLVASKEGWIIVPEGCVQTYRQADGWNAAPERIITAGELDSPVISFKDPAAKALCVDRWDRNGDGELTEREAASVTNFWGGSEFKTFRSFDEFVYFTSVTEIGSNFENASNLTSIQFPPSLKEIGYSAFYRAGLQGSLTLPAGLETIGDFAFAECTGLTGTLVLPASLTSIGRRAFYKCSGFTGDLTIPNGVTVIHDDTFFECSGMDGTLTLQENMQYIEEWAFACSPFSRIDVLAQTIPVCEEHSFELNGDNCLIYVPAGQAAIYQETDGWYAYRKRITEEGHQPYEFFYTSKDYSRDGEVVCLQKATEGKGIDLVFLGDGYLDRDLEPGGKFETDMRLSMELSFALEPYRTFRNWFNVYIVKAVSKHNVYQSAGSDRKFTEDVPDSSGGYGINIFRGECQFYVEKAPTNGQPWTAMFVNSDNEVLVQSFCSMGGGRGCMAFIFESFKYGAPLVLNHELGGHGFGLLADEYVSYPDPPSPPQEFIESFHSWDAYPNADWHSDPTMVPWARFIQDSRYAYENLGAYEGAATYAYGLYRPTMSSVMQVVHDRAFYNAPSREAIYKKIMQWGGEDGWTYDYETFVAIDEAGRTQAQEMMSGKGAAQAPNRTGRGVLKVKDAPKPGLPPIRLDGPVREIRVSSNGKVTLVR